MVNLPKGNFIKSQVIKILKILKETVKYNKIRCRIESFGTIITQGEGSQVQTPFWSISACLTTDIPKGHILFLFVWKNVPVNLSG